MKTFVFFLFVLIISGCSNSEFSDIVNNSSNNTLSRSSSDTVRDTTSYFNWESNHHIKLLDIPGDVTLPWYSGATGAIPSFILENYKAIDGWNLLYNFCTPTVQGKIEKGKHYLFFYNIFSGALRIFVYNTNDISSSNHTFWRLYFNNRSALLNDFDDFLLSNDKKSEKLQMIATTCTTSIVKSLSKGWNCAEFSLLTYDPTISLQNLNMGLDFYDIEEKSIKLEGNIDLSSEGIILTNAESATASNLSKWLNKGITAFGDVAIKAIEAETGTTNQSAINVTSRGFFAEAVIKLLEAGANKLVSKFTARKGNTPAYNSDIKISTKGGFTCNGNLITTKHANIPSLMHIMVPGTTPTPEDIYLPSYNKPLGVWNIKSAPILRVSKYSDQTFDIIDSKCNEKGEEMLYGYKSVDNYVFIKKDEIEVELNPEIIDKIEKYETEVSIVANGNITPDINHRYSSSYYIGKKIGSNSVESISSAIRYRTVTSTRDEWIFAKDMRKVKFTRKELPIYVGLNDNFHVKVTVTLYPKSPYNTTPIVSTRTFQCIKDPTPSEDRYY